MSDKERKPEFTTSWGAARPRVYGPADLPADVTAADAPGEFPFTRGVHPGMYRSRLWTMRQYAGFGTAVETNKRYRFLLEQGQTGLSVAFDLPTQMGHDPDALDRPRRSGQGGRVDRHRSRTWPISSRRIPLERVSTSMTINATAADPVGALRGRGPAAGRRARSPERHGPERHPQGIHRARAPTSSRPTPSMRLITDIFAWCRTHVPRWNTISISGYHIREAGSTAVQEVAFTLANGIAYVQAALDAGLDVDAFAPQLSFFFNAHNDLLEEIAKFRAARRLWARIMRERFEARDPRSLMLRFHAQTAGQHAHRPAAREQHRARDRAGAGRGAGRLPVAAHQLDGRGALAAHRARGADRAAHPADPGRTSPASPTRSIRWRGSFAVERLTRDIEEGAEAYITQIDELGGLGGRHRLHAAGDPGRGLSVPARGGGQGADRGRRQRVRHRRSCRPTNLFQLEAGVGDALAERLARAAAHPRCATAAGAGARCAGDRRARPGEPDAAAGRCGRGDGVTLGEICERLRAVFGIHQPSVTF